MPPLICPQPPDCPLYAQRVDYGQDEPLRRAVLMERRTSPDLAELVRAEALTKGRTVPALLPAPTPVPLPIFLNVKKGAKES